MLKKPAQLDPVADAILTRIAGFEEAGEIVLGGYFALQHYAPYRTTHDIVAWWKKSAVDSTERAIAEVMSTFVQTLDSMSTSIRRFGETASFELTRGGKRFFSFQISRRSIQIDPPVPSAWSPVLIETLDDNIGSKMNALVSRGAPRYFQDIKHVIDTGLTTWQRCWGLWHLKNPGESPVSACRQVLSHLIGLELRRPLDSIQNPDERARARVLREWYRAGLTSDES